MLERKMAMWNGNRLSTLDTLRGVAAVVVFWFHLNSSGWTTIGFQRGYLAVDLFFLISGFIIATKYDIRFRDGLTWIQFFRIRFIRLFPIFLVGFFLGIIIELRWIFLSISTFPETIIRETFNFFILPVPLMYGELRLFLTNTPSWSLFFELWIANLSFCLFWKYIHGWRLAALIGVGALGVVLAETHYGNLNGGVKWATAPVALARVLFSFYAGVWLARWHTISPPRIHLPAWALLVILLCALCLPFQGWGFVASELCSVFLIFPAVVRWGSAETQTSSRLGGKLGEISFGIYIIHTPVIFLVSRLFDLLFITPGNLCALALIVSTAAIAYLLNKFYDPPARRLLSRLLNNSNPGAKCSKDVKLK